MAVLVPAAVLHFTAAADRRAAGLTAPPFAWPRVLVAHLVTVLPLGIIVALWLRSHQVVNEMARGAWLAIGFGTTVFASTASEGLGESIAASGISAAPLVVLRAALALGLVLPWCVAALDGSTRPDDVPRPGLVFGVGLGFAVIPCGMYAEAVAEARTEQAREFLGRERLVKAEAVLTGLCELGSECPIESKSPAELRKALAAHIPKLRRVAEQPLQSSAPPPAQIGRAALLIQLDRLDAAANLLRPLAPADDTATLLLATVYRDQERRAASDELYSARPGKATTDGRDESRGPRRVPHRLRRAGVQCTCRSPPGGCGARLVSRDGRSVRRPSFLSLSTRQALRRWREALPRGRTS